MNSIGFPKMFSGNSTIIKEGLEATKECEILLLGSEQGEMFGDPEFGIKLKRYTFDQNNYILRDILIDEIYEKLNMFCPQISVRRNDIKILQQGKTVYVRIKATNREDFVTSSYDLVLLEDEER